MLEREISFHLLQMYRQMCIFNINYNKKTALLKKTADIPEDKALARVDSFTALDSSD